MLLWLLLWEMMGDGAHTALPPAPGVPLARNVTLRFRPQRTVAPTITSRTVTVTFGAV